MFNNETKEFLRLLYQYSNTTPVTVQRCRNFIFYPIAVFKYNTCYYSTNSNRSALSCMISFKYNTCYYSTAIFCNASFTSLFKYNLCYYSTHFCFKRICENPIQTQHLLLFNYLTSTALYPGFKFKYNTCYCSTLSKFHFLPDCCIQIQHLLLFN